MDKDRLSQRLMATFLGELQDHLRSLERDLLALERQTEPAARQALFTTLFRSAHSLKGAARSVGVEALEAAGHRLEELFAAGRDGRRPVDAVYFKLVLPAVDEIRAAGRRLQATADNANAIPDAQKAPAPPTVPDVVHAAPSLAPGEQEIQPPASDPWSGVVRVASAKLDALLAQSGELLVLRHRARARTEAARTLQEAAGGWQKAWRRIEQQVAELMHHDGDDPLASDVAEESPRQKVSRVLGHHKASMSRFARDVQALVTELSADCRIFEQTADWIDAEVHRVRLLPFAEACEGLDRMVRDLAGSRDKRVEVVIEGGDFEIDRSVLEGLKDPLIHLVRNAVDHGIESVATRRAAGKPASGRIGVAAAVRKARLEITIIDDGQGLDLAAIRERLRKLERLVPQDEQELVEQIFQPGFSTARSVTALSGRGVGLDIVQDRLRSMRGTVRVSYVPGRGTTFVLRVPLTLTSLRALIVDAARQSFAIDLASVERILRLGAEDIRSVEGREAIMVAERPMLVVALAQLLGLSDDATPVTGQKRFAVVVSEGGRSAAVVVDDIRAEREVVVRPFGRRLRRVRHVTGPTLLPDGGIALILNSGDLVDSVRKLSAPSTVAQSMTVTRAAESRRLLLVDDSITTRTLEKTILETAGYEVLIATDGIEAWQMLLDRGADLVVSDVEMPRMDGFALTEAIRNSKQFRELPVILMTARDNDADKAQGLKAGANAYLFKSAFDQRELLATIGQIL